MRKLIVRVSQFGMVAGFFGALAMRSMGVEYTGYAWSVMWLSVGAMVLTAKPADLKTPAQ